MCWKTNFHSKKPGIPYFRDPPVSEGEVIIYFVSVTSAPVAKSDWTVDQKAPRLKDQLLRPDMCEIRVIHLLIDVLSNSWNTPSDLLLGGKKYYFVVTLSKSICHIKFTIQYYQYVLGRTDRITESSRIILDDGQAELRTQWR